MVQLDSMIYALSPIFMGLITSLLACENIFIYLNDIPVNIYAMQKAEWDIVGLDCLHKFVVVAMPQRICEKNDPLCL